MGVVLSTKDAPPCSAHATQFSERCRFIRAGNCHCAREHNRKTSVIAARSLFLLSIRTDQVGGPLRACTWLLALLCLGQQAAVAEGRCSQGAQQQGENCEWGSSRAMVWKQHEITLPAFRRGCHLVTDHILKEVSPSLKGLSVGLLHVFIQHTSASLTINENYDPDVRRDFETWFNLVVPEGSKAPWVHTMEGPDDMPAHIKASTMGSSVSVPITHGKLNMGTWQAWLMRQRLAA